MERQVRRQDCRDCLAQEAYPVWGAVCLGSAVFPEWEVCQAWGCQALVECPGPVAGLLLLLQCKEHLIPSRSK